jgi:hypothetical protein
MFSKVVMLRQKLGYVANKKGYEVKVTEQWIKG